MKATLLSKYMLFLTTMVLLLVLSLKQEKCELQYKRDRNEYLYVNRSIYYNLSCSFNSK